MGHRATYEVLNRNCPWLHPFSPQTFTPSGNPISSAGFLDLFTHQLQGHVRALGNLQQSACSALSSSSCLWPPAVCFECSSQPELLFSNARQISSLLWLKTFWSSHFTLRKAQMLATAPKALWDPPLGLLWHQLLFLRLLAPFWPSWFPNCSSPWLVPLPDPVSPGSSHGSLTSLLGSVLTTLYICSRFQPPVFSKPPPNLDVHFPKAMNIF